MASFEDTQPQNIPNKVTPLTNSKQMDLIIMSSNPQIQALWELMELIILDARDEAMETDPAKREEQLAKMTMAHDFDKFYKRVRDHITYITREHLAAAQRLEVEKTLGTAEELERYLLQM